MLLGVVLFVAFPFEKEFSPFLVHLVFVIKKIVSYKRQHDSLFQFQLCGYCIVHRLIRSEISLKWHDMITIISPNALHPYLLHFCENNGSCLLSLDAGFGPPLMVNLMITLSIQSLVAIRLKILLSISRYLMNSI